MSEFKKLEGVIPPMITPFKMDGEIDEAALREVVDFLLERVHGLFICGSYGSGPLMRPEQRKRCAEIVTDGARGRVTVIAQVGCTDTTTAVSLAKDAERAGVDRIASYPPFYYHHNETNVLGYFETLVESVNLPVYVYNNPKLAGYPVSPGLLKRMEEVGVAGVKDSSFDVMVLWDYMVACSEHFDVVLGSEAIYLPASALGAKAFVPGLGNAFPELMVSLWQACSENDRNHAIDLHRKVLALRGLMHQHGPTTVVVQEMLKLRGINAGLPRAPFMALNEETKKKLAASVETMQIEIRR